MLLSHVKKTENCAHDCPLDMLTILNSCSQESYVSSLTSTSILTSYLLNFISTSMTTNSHFKDHCTAKKTTINCFLSFSLSYAQNIRLCFPIFRQYTITILYLDLYFNSFFYIGNIVIVPSIFFSL